MVPRACAQAWPDSTRQRISMRKSDFYFCGVSQFTGRSSQCSTCPDSANCARLLEEKWRQAYNAVFRFGLSSLQRPLRLAHCSTVVLRPMPTINCLSFSAYAGRGQSTAVSDTPCLSNNRESIYGHLYVRFIPTSPIVHMFLEIC